MQSKISFFNRTVFKKNMMHYWPIWFVYFLVCLFEIPFGIYMSVRTAGFYESMTTAQLAQERTYLYVNQINRIMSPPLLFIVALIVAMAMMSYLYSTKSANMIHSLPVRREELFVTNYASGLLFMLAPQAVATLLGVFVCAACGITDLQYLMVSFLYTTGMTLFFFSFAVFVGMFTGQLLALPFFYIILNFLEIGMETVIKMLMASICFGVSGVRMSKLSALSPAYFLTANATIGVEYLKDGGYAYTILGGKVVLIYALLSIAFFFAALFAYKKRKIEAAGDMVSVGWVKPVFRWGVTFCGGFVGALVLGQMFENTVSAQMEFILILIGLIVVGFICFSAAEMFLEKKFKIFHRKRMLEFGVWMVLVAAIFGMLEADAFGIEKKVPDASNVVWVSIDSCDTTVINDAQEIAKIIDVHKQIIANKKSIEAYAAEHNYDTMGVTISYKLSTGEKFTRSYQLPNGEEQIEDENSEIGQIITILEKPENYMKSQFGLNYKTNEFLNGYLQMYTKTEDGFQENDVTFDAENANIVYEAIYKDIAEGNFRSVIQYKMNYNSLLDDTVYANSVNLEYYNKEGIVDAYSLLYGDTDSADVTNNNARMSQSSSSSAYIVIGKECKNTIAALIQIGAIKDESELITQSDMNMQTAYTTY